jgi:hypothetical protein
MVQIVKGPETSDQLGAAADPKLHLWGFAIAETASTGATAEVILRHGTSTDGAMIVPPINLAADGYGSEWWPWPVRFPDGIFIDRVSGDTTIVLYVDYQ